MGIIYKEVSRREFVNEIQQDLKEPLFTVAWLAKWQGVITDNVMGAKAGGNTAAEPVQAKSVTI